MQVNPAERNGTGKQKKQYGKDPPAYRIHFMIPKNIDKQSKKSKRRKGMTTGKTETIDILH